MPAAALASQATLPSPLYVFLKGGSYITITGAVTREQLDVLLFDGSTHSQLVDSSIMGNPHKMPMVLNGAESDSAASFSGTTYSVGNTAGIKGAQALANEDAPVASGVKPGGTTDVDMVFETTPGMTQKTRSLLVWKDATPKIVGEAWADQVIGWSGSIPVRL